MARAGRSRRRNNQSNSENVDNTNSNGSSNALGFEVRLQNVSAEAMKKSETLYVFVPICIGGGPFNDRDINAAMNKAKTTFMDALNGGQVVISSSNGQARLGASQGNAKPVNVVQETNQQKNVAKSGTLSDRPAVNEPANARDSAMTAESSQAKVSMGVKKTGKSTTEVRPKAVRRNKDEEPMSDAIESAPIITTESSIDQPKVGDAEDTAVVDPVAPSATDVVTDSAPVNTTEASQTVAESPSTDTAQISSPPVDVDNVTKVDENPSSALEKTETLAEQPTEVVAEVVSKTE